MIGDYENPLVSLNKALYIGAGYFLGGGIGGVQLSWKNRPRKNLSIQ